MSKYEWSDDMREISGFGGGYEAMCRSMVVAGLEWLDAHPDADPKFHGYKGITGILDEDNEDAKALSAAILAVCPDCTGAMHQFTVGHCLKAKELGWDAYVAKMREMKRAEGPS